MEIGGLRCGESSWKERGGITNGEKDIERGNAKNWRQKCLCDTIIWERFQNTTVTGVLIFMKQEIIV